MEISGHLKTIQYVDVEFLEKLVFLDYYAVGRVDMPLCQVLSFVDFVWTHGGRLVPRAFTERSERQLRTLKLCVMRRR